MTTSDLPNDEPVMVHEYRWRGLFGILRLTHTVEDRRPDLTREECQRSLGYKYKIRVKINMLWKQWSLVIHSKNTGCFFENEREVW